MRYLRERNGNVETVYHSTRYTPEQKSTALDILRGAVVVARHPYERCKHSGAGNCWCGRSESESLHKVITEPTDEAE